MALQGPLVVVADSPAPDVVEALRAAGAFPIVEADWAEAAAALASVEPEAVVVAEPCADRARAKALCDRLKAREWSVHADDRPHARRRRGVFA